MPVVEQSEHPSHTFAGEWVETDVGWEAGDWAGSASRSSAVSMRENIALPDVAEMAPFGLYSSPRVEGGFGSRAATAAYSTGASWVETAGPAAYAGFIPRHVDYGWLGEHSRLRGRGAGAFVMVQLAPGTLPTPGSGG